MPVAVLIIRGEAEAEAFLDALSDAQIHALRAMLASDPGTVEMLRAAGLIRDEEMPT